MKKSPANNAFLDGFGGALGLVPDLSAAAGMGQLAALGDSSTERWAAELEAMTRQIERDTWQLTGNSLATSLLQQSESLKLASLGADYAAISKQITSQVEAHHAQLAAHDALRQAMDSPLKQLLEQAAFPLIGRRYLPYDE